LHIPGLKASLRKLEHENADLRFLNSQYIHKVKAVERESAAKTDTIQKLQEKNLQAVIQTPGNCYVIIANYCDEKRLLLLKHYQFSLIFMKLGYMW